MRERPLAWHSALEKTIPITIARQATKYEKRLFRAVWMGTTPGLRNLRWFQGSRGEELSSGAGDCSRLRITSPRRRIVNPQEAAHNS